MRYLPKSPSERQEMLASLRLGSVEGLFEYLPDELRLKRSLNIPPGKSEYEIIDYFRQRAEENAAGYASFLGAGVYRHYRPVVIDSLATRGEFLTAYTPYQAEISQGVLTTIFEFQTMVCQLTGMEVANASMYDGSTAVPEAAMMASRITARDKILVARSLHPEYREVVRTYHRYQDSSIQEVAYDRETGQIDLADLERKLTPEVAAVIVQSPNFFGCIERTREASKLAHKHGALLVVVFTEAVSLGLLQPPLEADIVAGELQSFAHPSSYGGPFVGVLATKEKYIRQIPGRLVGETVDSNGNRAFCLTLATREQHIRRAKATSNICTNQALVALMATIFMSIYGRRGLRELAEQNLAKAHYLATQLKKRGATLPFRAPFFNEFVMQTNGSTASEINRRALERKVIGGLELGRFYPELEGSMVLCTTEVNRQTEMDSFVEACSEQH